MRFKGKAAALTVLFTLAAMLLTGCSVMQKIGMAGFYSGFPAGFTAKDEHFDPEGFQDFTDYCKYYYPDASGFEKDSSFVSVADEGVNRVKGFFKNFREWMETSGRLDEYDFDDSIITPDDLVRIELKEHLSIYDDYDVYFFDRGTNTLYYIHNNI